MAQVCCKRIYSSELCGTVCPKTGSYNAVLLNRRAQSGPLLICATDWSPIDRKYRLVSFFQIFGTFAWDVLATPKNSELKKKKFSFFSVACQQVWQNVCDSIHDYKNVKIHLPCMSLTEITEFLFYWRVRLQHTSPVCNLSTLRLQVPSTQDKHHISWADFAELCCPCCCLIKDLATASLLEYVVTHSPRLTT